MNELGQSFILGLLPILLGAALFLILTRFNPLGKKYVLTHSVPNHIHVESPSFPKTFGCVTSAYLRDRLIINGVCLQDESALQEAAFSKLGLLKVSELELLLKIKYPKRLELVANRFESEALSNLPYSSPKAFASILPYALSSSLKMVIL